MRRHQRPCLIANIQCHEFLHSYRWLQVHLAGSGEHEKQPLGRLRIAMGAGGLSRIWRNPGRGLFVAGAALVQHAALNVNFSVVLARMCGQSALDLRCVGGYRHRGPFICPKLKHYVHSPRTCAIHFTANEGRLRCNDLALLANRRH